MQYATKHLVAICSLALVLVPVFSFNLLQPTPAHAQSFNQEINYQGKLTASTSVPVADGVYSMQFRLYTAQTGGSNLWSETQDVTVTSGLFSVMLGSSTSLSGVDFNQTLYLGVNIESDGEMTPRKILGAVPAAFEAGNSQTVGGVASTSFLRNDIPNAASALLSFTGGFISSASSTISELTAGTTTVTTFVIDGEEYTSISGGSSGLTNNAGTLTANISESNLNIAGTPTDDYVLQASSTAVGGFVWQATSSLGFSSQTLTVGADNQIPFVNGAGSDLEYSNAFTFDGSNLNLGGTNTGLAFQGTRMFYASTTNDSIAIGENAGATFVDTTLRTIAIGLEAGQYASSSNTSSNNLIGYRAGRSNTGSVNNIFGPNAGRENSGDDNNLFGNSAGLYNQGDDNNIFGIFAGLNNTGDNNTFMGREAGFQNTGNDNVFIGHEAGYQLQSTSSILIGAQIFRGTVSPFSALNNTVIGYRAGASGGAGADNNILFGYQAADNLTTGSNNIVLGYDVDMQDATQSNTLNIGNLLFGTGIDGTGTSLSSGNIGIGTSSPASKLDVWGDFRVGTSSSPSLFVDTSANQLMFGTTTAYETGGVYLENQRINFRNTGNLTRAGYIEQNSLGQLQISSDGSLNLGLDGSSNERIMLQISATGLTINNGGLNRDFIVKSDNDANLIATDGANNLVGIGTSTPTSKLTVAGDAYITGALRDSTNSAGTTGYILQTTGAGTQWVATSSLGIGGGGATTFTGLTDTQGSLTANRLIFTNSGGTALTDSAGLTFDGTNLDLAGTNTGLAFQGTRMFYASTTNGSIAIGESAGSSMNSASTNNIFIGREAGASASTTDNIDNIFIGYQAGQFSEQRRQTFIGRGAGQYNEGEINTAVGRYAGQNNSGDRNAVFGYQTGLSMSGSDNSAIGFEAGAVMSGSFNTALGYEAGRVVAGSYNNAIGYRAGYENTGDYAQFMGYETGASLRASATVAIGDFALRGTGSLFGAGDETVAENNTALGYRAGYSIATGADNNLLLGYRAADSLTTGANNIIIGYDVEAPSNTADNQLNIGNLIFGTGIDGTGTTLSSGNIGIGTSSPNAKLTVAGDINIDNPSSGISFMGTRMFYASSTNDSIAIGDSAGAALLDTGVDNIAIGREALAAATSSEENIAIGARSLNLNTSGDDNVAIGVQSLEFNTSGRQNVAIGSTALRSNTTGLENTAIGFGALDSNTTGIRNFGLGIFALSANTTGGSNVAIGRTAMQLNVSGSNNIGIGSNAAKACQDCLNQIGLGSETLEALVSGNNNIAIGRQALEAAGTSSNSVAIGYQAGDLLSEGNNNIFFGYRAADSMTTGSNNLIIGYDVEAPSNTGSNQLNIGNLIFSEGIDGTGTTLSSGNIGIGTTSPSSKLDVWGDFRVGTSSLSTLSVNPATGYVGIGTSTPTSFLDIYPTSNSVNALSVWDNNGNDVGIAMIGNAGSGALEINVGGQIMHNLSFDTVFNETGSVSYDFRIEGDTDENLLFLKADGDSIGIGTTSPASKLDVWGDFRVGTSSTPSLFVDTSANQTMIGTTTAYGTGGLYLEDSSVVLRNSNRLDRDSVITTTGAGYLYLDSSSTFILNAGGDNIMQGIANQGVNFNENRLINLDFTIKSFLDDELFVADAGLNMIGLSTTTPSQLLTVDGNAYITGALFDSTNASGTNGMVLQSTGSGTQWVATSSLGIGGGGGSSLTVGSDNQIPFSNSGGTDFDYSADFTFDGTDLNLGGTNTSLAFQGTRMFYASTTNDSIAIGEGAGENFTADTTFNVALGFGAGQNVSSASSDYNNFIGRDAGSNSIGNYNNLIGRSAGYNNSGLTNNIFGFEAGYQNSGSHNSIIGSQAGYNNTGFYSEFIGYEAGAVMSASNTVAIGGLALRGGSDPTFFGNAATTTNNTVIGYGAGYNAATGADNNILLGYQAADNLTTGSNNIVLGYDVDMQDATQSNTLNIGNLLFGTGIDGTGTSLSSGNIGIGTTSPSSKLDVWGDFRVGTSSNPSLFVDTAANQVILGSSTPYSGATGNAALYLPENGRIVFEDNDSGRETSLEAGTNGYFDVVSDVFINFNIGGVSNSEHVMRLSSNGVTINEFANADKDFRVEGDTDIGLLFTDASTDRVGIGTTSPSSKLSIANTGFSGAGTIGLDQYLTTANSVTSALQYGSRTYIDNTSNTATTSLVGNAINLADNTTFGNTVRGLEVQADLGSNTQGENTALSGFARTFGVRGYTSADAGGSFEPAGGFFETGGTTQGNAIRGYSSSITSASLLSLFQDTSAFTGTGLEMNFGNTTGDFASTSSKYLDFQNAGTSIFTVSAFGTTTIGANDDTTANMAGLQIPYGGICVDNDGRCTASTTGNITAVSYGTANSDLAENYFSADTLAPGELVTLGGGLSVNRAETTSELPILGVVSTKPGLTLGFDDTSLNAGETAYPIALSGRVPVKLSTENGPIQKGDRLMLSSLPGVAMKATGTGMTIGIALEDFDDSRMYSDTYLNQFADDMVDPVYEPVVNNTDPRINDGCYYGGGSAAGDAPCVPLVSTSTAGQIAEVNDRLETESVAAQIADLRREQSDRATLEDGTSVQVGQVVMFVENQYKWVADDQLAMLGLLGSDELLAEAGEDETLFDRLVSLANSFVDGVFSIFELRADRVEVAEELCVDGVCVTGEQLRALLENSGQSVSSPDAAAANTNDDAPEENTTSGGDTTDAGSGADTPADTSGTSTDTATTSGTTTATTTTTSSDDVTGAEAGTTTAGSSTTETAVEPDQSAASTTTESNNQNPVQDSQNTDTASSGAVEEDAATDNNQDTPATEDAAENPAPDASTEDTDTPENTTEPTTTTTE